MRSRASGLGWGMAVAGVSLALSVIWQPARAEDEQTKLAAEGRAIAEQRCGRCHAIGAADKSPHAKAPPFRFVAERYPSENLAEALAEGIVTGHADMPVFVFDPPAIEAFLAYMNSLPPATAEDAANAKKNAKPATGK